MALKERGVTIRTDPLPRLGTIVWPNGADIDPDVLYSGRTPAAWEPEPSHRSAS